MKKSSKYKADQTTKLSSGTSKHSENINCQRHVFLTLNHKQRAVKLSTLLCRVPVARETLHTVPMEIFLCPPNPFPPFLHPSFSRCALPHESVCKSVRVQQGRSSQSTSPNGAGCRQPCPQQRLIVKPHASERPSEPGRIQDLAHGGYAGYMPYWPLASKRSLYSSSRVWSWVRVLVSSKSNRPCINWPTEWTST